MIENGCFWYLTSCRSSFYRSIVFSFSLSPALLFFHLYLARFLFLSLSLSFFFLSRSLFLSRSRFLCHFLSLGSRAFQFGCDHAAVWAVDTRRFILCRSAHFPFGHPFSNLKKFVEITASSDPIDLPLTVSLDSSVG